MPRDADDLSVTVDFLDAFAAAWNRHAADAIISMMTPDCVLDFSAGPEVHGRRTRGRTEVKGAILDFFRTMPDAQWNGPTHFIAGDRGVTEWIFTGTGNDGCRIEVAGCDLFTFRDGKIAVKNSYRKQRAG